MKLLCKDSDLLKYESKIFNEPAFDHFAVCKTLNATLSDGFLSANNVDFSQANVGAGSVVYLRDDVNNWHGFFEVVQGILAGQVQVSIIRPSADDEPIAPPNASGLRLSVVSFKPIIYETSLEIAKHFALAPATASDLSVWQVNNLPVLRRAACMGTLAKLFACMPFTNEQTENQRILQKQDYYRRQYRKAKESLALEIDSTGNSLTDTVITAGIQLRRG